LGFSGVLRILVGDCSVVSAHRVCGLVVLVRVASLFPPGTLKMQDRKMQDWNLEDNLAGPHILIFFFISGASTARNSRLHDGQATS